MTHAIEPIVSRPKDTAREIDRQEQQVTEREATIGRLRGEYAELERALALNETEASS